MIKVSVLTPGLHPAEIVSFLIFLWTIILFSGLIKQKAEDRGKRHTLYLIGLLLFTYATFFDIFDNLPGLRFLDYVEHISFMAGSIFFTLGVYRTFKSAEHLVVLK